jgi:RNA polymerase sigma factor (sigma-70 family)
MEKSNFFLLFYHYLTSPLRSVQYSTLESIEQDMSELTDAELVVSAKAGDKDAFGQLVHRYQLMTVGVSMRIVANEDVARELAQEAMLQAYVSLNNLRDADRFRSWLYGIVLNLCYSYLRSWQSSLSKWAGGLHVDTLALASHEPVLDEIIQQRELYASIREQIDSLSPKKRETVSLFYYDQLSLEEIADVLGISVTAVKSRLYKSRKQLKTLLVPLLADGQEFVSERKPKMIPVTAVHAVKNVGTENYILMLLNQPGRQVLPIWVGPQEGEHIMLRLRQFPTSRPMTFQFIADLLATSGVNPKEVYINALKYDVFYASVITHNSKGIQEVDARPSDAIALALYAGFPIFVAEEVMASAGRELPQAFDEEAWQKTPLNNDELEKVYGIIYPQLFDIEEELNRFTKRAQVAWQRAHEEAKQRHCNYVGTEHLLLAFMHDEESLAAQVLREMGTKTEQVKTMVDDLVGRNLLPHTGEPAVVPQLTEIVHLAEEERRVLGHQFIGTEHLLLGLVKEGKGAAANILRDLGVNFNQARTQIIDHITRK